MQESNKEYYDLYYKCKSVGLSSSEKRKINDIAYQKAMESRKRNPKRYGLLLIGIAYEDMWRSYSKRKNKEDCTILLYYIDRMKIRINEICSIYSISKAEVLDYFEKNRYITSFYLI